VGKQAAVMGRTFKVLMHIEKKEPLKVGFLGVLSNFLMEKSSTK
jgi:hypothetical protein